MIANHIIKRYIILILIKVCLVDFIYSQRRLPPRLPPPLLLPLCRHPRPPGIGPLQTGPCPQGTEGNDGDTYTTLLFFCVCCVT
jgi:hypothetical protein